MSRRTLDISEVSPTQRLDWCIEWLLIALLTFMPLALGVVEPWSETVTLAATMVLALLLAVRQARSDARTLWTWAYVPMLLFLALAGLQLIPLRENIVGWISPGTLSLKSRLLGAGAASRGLTLSFYPHATRHDLSVILVAGVVFLTVLHVHNSAAQIKRLLATIAIIGGCVGALALLEYLTGTFKVYWTIPTPRAHMRPNGTFILYNNYTQFMNLSMGAALALLLVRSREMSFGRGVSISNLAARWREPEYRFIGWLATVLAIGVISIFLSMSRAGMISLMIALVLTLVSLARRRNLRAHLWIVIAIAAVGGMALLYVGFDTVSTRLATLYRLPDPSGGRMQIIRDVWQESFPRFPLVGMGLGTFEMTYPMFDRSNIAQVAVHADSDYIQALHEMGAIGVCLILLFIAVIAVNYFRATRSGRRSICLAAFGLGYGLIAVLIQSGSDFGQHLPSIAALSAVSCALLIRLGRWPVSPSRSAATPEGAIARAEKAARPKRAAGIRWPVLPVRVAMPVCLLIGVGWALSSTDASRVAMNQWIEASQTADRLESQDWAGADQDYAQLISQATIAVQSDPDDVDHRYWLGVYRWHALDHALPPTTDSDPNDYVATARPSPDVPNLDDAAIAKLKPFDETQSKPADSPDSNPAATQPAAGLAPATQPTTRPAAPAIMHRFPADKLPGARALVADLLESRRVCPTYGSVYSLAGQIEHLILHDPAGPAHIEAGYALERDNATTCFASGMLEATQGHWETARERLHHTVALNGELLPEVVAACAYQLHRPAFAIDITADNVNLLCRTADLLARDGGFPKEAADAGARAVAELKAKDLPDLNDASLLESQRAYMLSCAADVCMDQADYALAASYYRRVLALQYENVVCRFHLAECLLALGQNQRATHEARVCLRFSPNHSGAKKLIADAAVLLPDAANGSDSQNGNAAQHNNDAPHANGAQHDNDPRRVTAAARTQ